MRSGAETEARLAAEAASLPRWFPCLLADLKESSQTGVLQINAEGVRTVVHVRNGDPVFAEGGTVRDTLGRLLLRTGRIREDEYARVIQHMSQTLLKNPAVRLGEVLVELGILSPPEVYEVLKLQVREKIIACFQWKRFDDRFQPLEALAEGITSFECPQVEALILEGLKMHFDLDRLDALLDLHAKQYPTLTEPRGEIAQRFHMEPMEQRFLLTIDGERTLASVRRRPPLNLIDSSRILAALLITKRLAMLDTPRAANRPPRGPRRQPLRKPSPAPSRERRSRPSPTEAPASAAVVEAQSATAAQPGPQRQRTGRLARPGRAQPAPDPSEREEKQAKLEAEQAFRHGKRLLRDNRITEALAEFRRAAELQEQEVEYQMYATWTESRSAKGDEARLFAGAKARAFALKVLRGDPSHAKAHSILAQLLYDEGEREAAERHFKLAVRSDPDDFDAKRWLRHLTKMRTRG